MDPKDMLAGLSEPFARDQIESRPIGGGKNASFLKIDTVIQRLNDICISWDFRITYRSMQLMALARGSGQNKRVEDVSVYVVEGELTIPGLGTRAGIGVQALDDGAGEDLIKGALSDAIKVAAAKFGVGLDLSVSAAPQRQAPKATNLPAQIPQAGDDTRWITDQQKQAISNLAKKRGWSMEDVEQVAAQQFGEQVDALTENEARNLIKRMQG